MRRMRRRGLGMRRSIAVLGVAVLVASGCQSSAEKARGRDDVVRLGVFPNLTHAPGLVAIASGILQAELGNVRLDVKVFNSGSDAASAISSGSLDATYIGPVPATSLFEQGADVRVVSGATQNGASLVVRVGSGIEEPEDLAGKKVAVPGIGNTQDIALRTWLRRNGLKTTDDGGDVAVLAVDNTTLPQLFQQGEVDAAWEPEPWPSLLIEMGLATELVDETDLWPERAFPTTVLIVAGPYLEAHPETVRSLVEANLEAIRFIESKPDQARKDVRRELEELGAPPLPPAALERAWSRLRFSYDPRPAEMKTYASRAYELDVFETKPETLSGLFALDLLNEIVASKGLPLVEAPA
jgi:NitT/TauT family transport system substrate-binding protein